MRDFEARYQLILVAPELNETDRSLPIITF
jgi:hypothetical protein